MPSADVLFSSPKKVFAHYLSTFPLSIDNRPPAEDYYNTQYLNKNGESNKWLAQGGFLRQRPLGVEPTTATNWRQRNMELEVSAAIARGITGFTFDVMSVDQATDTTGVVQTMLRAAEAVDPRFKIVVMPDVSVLKQDSAAVVKIVAAVANSPSAYRLQDGRLVVSAFDAGADTAQWWASVLATLNARGIEVAFVPTFLGWRASAEDFTSISYGFGDWGSATPAGSVSREPDAAFAHKTYDRIYMSPIDPQQFRPKSFLYWEAGNSAAIRAGWMSSIDGGADWVQIVTWNDFSESGEISPFTDATLARNIGTGFYNLSGFYAAWFLSGKEPSITHDVLYWFYRREPTNAAGPDQSQLDRLEDGVADNNIELVGFLIAPAYIKITIGGKTYSKLSYAGIVSLSVPTAPGIPVFTLTRNKADVFSFQGGVPIRGTEGLSSGEQDMTYWSGSASAAGICTL